MQINLLYRRVLLAMFGTAILFDIFKPVNASGAAVLFSGLVTWIVLHCE